MQSCTKSQLQGEIRVPCQLMYQEITLLILKWGTLRTSLKILNASFEPLAVSSESYHSPRLALKGAAGTQRREMGDTGGVHSKVL